MNQIIANSKLDKLFRESHGIKISSDDSFVIFSDLHMGDGSSSDDFLPNSQLFNFILEDYYCKRGYKLILNGDIEELYKFSLNQVIKTWKSTFDIFQKFYDSGKLYKIIGNHDYDLEKKRNNLNHINQNILSSLKLFYKNDAIFIYHGHQISNFFDQYNKLALYLVRYVIKPLGVMNPSVPIISDRRFSTEVRAYEHARRKKIISILGHTHRPLFESLSKVDTLNYIIENLFRKLENSSQEDRVDIEKRIIRYKNELESLYNRKDKKYNLRSSLFDNRLVVPCLFNSGAVIGKRGINGIEIKKGKIYLVYWFDQSRSTRYIQYNNVNVKKLDDSTVFKAILKKENLKYIFDKINLLS